MRTPELRQFGDLGVEDLKRHPVWVGCHTADYGKPWYEDTDEETFRPYKGKLPADSAKSMFLVRAVFVLRDGSRYPGFVTPAVEGWDKRHDGRPMLEDNHILGTQQPQMFIGDRFFGFWEAWPALTRWPNESFTRHLESGPRQFFLCAFIRMAI